MRHLDEGQLQAWLDGQRAGPADGDRAAVDHHLAECAECAARADALRESTARVKDLLAPAGAEEPPAFETVRARARARTAHPTRPRRRLWIAAGWAASVIVALGIGWLWSERGGESAERVAAVESSPRSEPEPHAEPAPPVQPVETPGAAADEKPVTFEAPRTAAAGDAAPGFAPAPAQPVDSSPPPADTPPREPTARAEAAAAWPGVPAGRTEDAAEPAPKPIVLRGRVLDARGRALPGAQVYVEDDDSVLNGALTRGDGSFTIALDPLADSVGEEVTLVAELIGFDVERWPVTLARADTPASEFRLSSEALNLEGIVVTGVSAAEPWRQVSRDEAEEIAGFAVRTVPGLPVLAVEVRTGGAAPQVRAIQALEDGARLVLIQAGRALPAEQHATNPTVSKQLEGGVFLVATAPLAADSLRSLLAGLR